MRYFFSDSIELNNNRYSDLKSFTNLTNLTNLTDLRELDSDLRSRLSLRFKALRGLRGCSSDLRSCIYYVVYRLSGV